MTTRCARALVAALLLLALTPMPATAAGPTAIRLVPATVDIGAGLTAAVVVRVENAEGLYGLDIRLAFDPAAVQVVDADPATPGAQVRPGDLLSLDMVARNTADNAAGTVWFAMTQVNPSPEVGGSGAAFTVTFRGVCEGARSPLTVTYARLASRDGRELPATTAGAELRVVAAAGSPTTPTPAPPPEQPALMRTASAPAPTPAATPIPAVAAEGRPAVPGPGVLGPLLAALAGCVLVLGIDRWRRRRPRAPE